MSFLDAFNAAVSGRFPDADGSVEFASAPAGVHAAVVAFTNHIIVGSSLSREWLTTHVDFDDIGFCLGATFISLLQDAIGRTADNLDLVLAAPSLRAKESLLRLREVDSSFRHERDQQARRYRSDVQTFVTVERGGLLCIGKGLDGRTEISIEVDSALRGQGMGRSLARASRCIVEDGANVFAQVAPGNTQSIRAFLAAGFVPVASEVLFLTDSSG